MSVGCIKTAIHDVHGLTPTSKFVLVILANYADQDNSCWPAHQHIADLVGIKNKKHIGKIIRELSKKGFLTINHRYKKDGGNTSNLYTLTLERGILQNTLPLEEPQGVIHRDPNTKEDTKSKNTETEFETFWKEYPRKYSKHLAKKAYQKITRDYERTKLLASVKKFAIQINYSGTPAQFIPYATTWLEKRYFLDYENITEEEIKQESEHQTKTKRAHHLDKQVEKWQIHKEVETPKKNPETKTKLEELAKKHNIKKL